MLTVRWSDDIHVVSQGTQEKGAILRNKRKLLAENSQPYVADIYTIYLNGALSQFHRSAIDIAISRRAMNRWGACVPEQCLQ